MSTIYCPNCRSEIPKPTTFAGWIMGTLAVLFGGGFLVIIICLAAATLFPPSNVVPQAQAQVEVSADSVETGRQTVTTGQRQ